MGTDYRHLSLNGVAADFAAMAVDADMAFGSLDARRLNWQPDETRWSIAQCFDHLLSTNTLMVRSMDAAMSGSASPSVWHRVPLLTRALGLMLITSQSPGAKRKFTAPRQARPASSAIDGHIIKRFVDYQHQAESHVRAFEGREVARIIMVSPFMSFVAYSVLDGCRIVVAHQRRHFEQARRVMEAPGFPAT